MISERSFSLAAIILAMNLLTSAPAWPKGPGSWSKNFKFVHGWGGGDDSEPIADAWGVHLHNLASDIHETVISKLGYERYISHPFQSPSLYQIHIHVFYCVWLVTEKKAYKSMLIAFRFSPIMTDNFKNVDNTISERASEGIKKTEQKRKVVCWCEKCQNKNKIMITVKCWLIFLPCYCIKQIDSISLCACFSYRSQMTPKCDNNISNQLVCSSTLATSLFLPHLC